FYLFDLPFYSEMLSLVLVTALLAAIVYWLTARGWQLSSQIEDFRAENFQFNVSDLRLGAALEARFFRISVAVFLLALAANFYLSRYDLLFSEHSFLSGMDYVDRNIRLPLQWLLVVAAALSAVLVLVNRAKFALVFLLVLLVQKVVPGIVSAVYVKPNEISLQKPYISDHIQATRAAFGLESKLKETQFAAKLDGEIDVNKNRAMLENVRLWDWRAFHDTVTQIQALRQYYVFNDTDVDRYTIDGNVRQVLLTPRELDVRQLADARANWINGHFIYTHGYGVVMAEANKITPNGQPVLFIQDAPPKVTSNSLKLTRPEIYFGELTNQSVFVRTQQPEFSYPSGSENVQTRYAGKGGFPVHPLPVRLAAALSEGDWKILLTNYLTAESRMLIRRNVRERLTTLASFIQWDNDPYMVLTPEGRLVWIVDGYTLSDRHPYSRRMRYAEGARFNYIRNSVKAVIDAYDGTVTLYNFDASDPILRAWQAIFPDLFQPAAAMPPELRAHTRYSEVLFQAQSEIYRTFHMQDPEAFYNKEDLWDLAKSATDQSGKNESMQPSFVVATLPGETKPEFLLVHAFTPRSKDNLIGVMIARSDGEHLGELVVLQLSKQSLIYGPLQIEARIASDQNIAKDLSLWNQQGSQVIRGQMLVLPVDDTFLYVEPIYLQSSQAKMPQLKKVVLAKGNSLIYRDTYEQALADLGANFAGPAPALSDGQAPPPVSQVPSAAPKPAAPSLDAVRRHLQRYRELASQGKWAEAGRELEALEASVK
ncbi:MAG: UPF0182 family protein, partial [Bryobacteraceae bacterium]|nr:UPF0182 family protein [Bryobacteraceae bacterium]